MSRLSYYEIPLQITFQAPLMVQSSGSLAFGLDSAFQRAPDGNNQPAPVIPGSLIRGNLRHAWTVFSKITPAKFTTTQIDTWLGKEGNNQNRSHAAELNFDYWWRTSTPENDSAMGYRVAINEATGAAEHGSLQVVEMPWSVNQRVEFSGNVCGWLDQAGLNKLTNWLRCGVAWANQMGAFKGMGYGIIDSATVGDAKEVPTLTQTERPDCATLGDRVGVCLAFDRPICFAKPNVGSNNRFVANDIVFGSALIATIVSQAKKLGHHALVDNMNQIYVSHAYPVARPAQATQTVNPRPSLAMPVAIPLCLANLGKNHYKDISHQPWDKTESLGFLPDWKADTLAQVQKNLGLHCPSRRLEVRTKIDEVTQAAATKKLFSLETCLTHQHDWLAKIDLGRVNQASKDLVKKQLVAVLSLGLEPLGKTKARAKVTLVPTPDYTIPAANRSPDNNAVNANQEVRIYLQTDARLLNNDFLTSDSDTGHQAILHEAYAQVWKKWSGGSLCLQRFFAQQSLVGGKYWWDHFAKQTKQGNNYHPELLTKAGSVFAFNYPSDKAVEVENLLQAWLRYGLPQPEENPDVSHDKQIESTDWQTNPYIAQNGFGAIAIDLDFENLGED